MEKTYPLLFKKAIKGNVGGRYLIKRGDGYVESEFLLQGDPAKVDQDEITIEIADEECEKYFIKYNKPTINNGYLVSASEYTLTVDKTNSIGDGDLKDILKLPYQKMVKAVGQFTSEIPVNRLLQFAIEADKPLKTVEFLRNAVARLEKK